MILFSRSAAAMQSSGRKAVLAASLLGAVLALTPATAAPPVFQSALDGYQSYQDQPTSEWKKVNDAVGAIGGWREYARQASETGTPSSASGKGTASATPQAKPKPGATTPEKARP